MYTKEAPSTYEACSEDTDSREVTGSLYILNRVETKKNQKQNVSELWTLAVNSLPHASLTSIFADYNW